MANATDTRPCGCDAGSELDGAVSNRLALGDLFPAPVSPDLLASCHCYDVEVAAALERRKVGTARVISAILRPGDWAGLAARRAVAMNVLRARRLRTRWAA